MSTTPQEKTERVLATLNEDGTRRWLQPKLSKGSLYKRRLVVAWALIFIFVALPHLRWAGKPLFLLNIPGRQFVLFGTTFLPTDTLLLLLVMLSIFLGIFLFTALFGRVWCGWACPQTVYMEFLFRPLERFFDGTPAQQRAAARSGKLRIRRLFKYPTFLIFAAILAHSFLAYFVGTEELWHWMQRSPFEHPTTFLIMVGTTFAIFADFAYFREQVCLVACPYGRFQSVLLDKQSLIVGYDYNRGESRGRKAQRKKAPEKEFGDCIDCGACVVTCPTGIDIRNGLQMECINCTQCIDACDTIMDKIGKPRGLIRYSSQERLEGEAKPRFFRFRIIVYPLLMVLLLSLLAFFVYKRAPIHTVLLRSNQPYRLMPDDQIANLFRLKVTNQRDAPLKVHISLIKQQGLRLVAPQNPLKVEPFKADTATFFVVFSRKMLREGRAKQMTVKVRTSTGHEHTETYRLVGPIQDQPKQ